MSDYCFGDKRNKRKDKKKERKKHPYVSGGNKRTFSISPDKKKWFLNSTLLFKWCMN